MGPTVIFWEITISRIASPLSDCEVWNSIVEKKMPNKMGFDDA